VSVIEIVLDFARKLVEEEQDRLKSIELEEGLFKVLYNLLAGEELKAQESNLLFDNLQKNSSTKASTSVLLDIFEGKIKLANLINR